MEERGGRRKEATGNKNHLIPSTILSNTFNVCDAPAPPPPAPRGDHCKLLARFALCAYTWVREGRGADSGARLRRFDLCDLRK